MTFFKGFSSENIAFLDSLRGKDLRHLHSVFAALSRLSLTTKETVSAVLNFKNDARYFDVLDALCHLLSSAKLLNEKNFKQVLNVCGEEWRWINAVNRVLYHISYTAIPFTQETFDRVINHPWVGLIDRWLQNFYPMTHREPTKQNFDRMLAWLDTVMVNVEHLSDTHSRLLMNELIKASCYSQPVLASRSFLYQQGLFALARPDFNMSVSASQCTAQIQTRPRAYSL